MGEELHRIRPVKPINGIVQYPRRSLFPVSMNQLQWAHGLSFTKKGKRSFAYFAFKSSEALEGRNIVPTPPLLK